MGAADAIPGVSGGTIALVLGIYETFIGSLNALVRLPFAWGDPKARHAALRALRFLVPLGAGLLLAYLVVARLLVGKPAHPGFVLRPETAPLAYAFFTGLVLASIREPFRRITQRSPMVFVLLAAGAAMAWFFTDIEYQTGTPPAYALFFGGAGAIAIMLLPGVSGSLFLVIMGQYQAVITAVNTFDIPALLPTLAGILFGVATFVPLLRWALRRAHDLTMGLLTGFLIGSLRAVWPWKDNYNMQSAPMREVWPESVGFGVVLAALLGAIVIIVLARLEDRLQGHPKQP